jgi:hypothetical protein
MRDGIVPGWPALIVGRGGPPGFDGPLTPGKLTFLPSAALVPTAADELSAPVLAAGASFFKRRKTTTPRLPKRRGALGQAHKVATGWQTRMRKRWFHRRVLIRKRWFLSWFTDCGWD